MGSFLGMLRRTAKISVRLGVLVAIAFVIKKVLDSQRKEPTPVRPVAPPTPEPDPEPAASFPDPEPESVPEAVVAPDPEPEPEPEPPEPAPEPEPEPAPEPAMAKPAKKAAKKAAPRPKREEPLKAKKAAKKATKAVRANRATTNHVVPDTPIGAILSWVEPVGGVCPPSHPIKVKLGSRVFRRPDSPGYENSKPDRCYASEGAARRGGFNESQR